MCSLSRLLSHIFAIRIMCDSVKLRRKNINIKKENDDTKK